MNSLKCLVFSTVALLQACGSSSEESAPSLVTQEVKASLTLNISDAPIDNAVAVVVEFDSVELVGNGDPVTFNVKDEQGAARQIDLLAFQGEDFATLLSEVDIQPGNYSQLRLNVTENSYIEMDTGTFNLRVPSNQLKLDGFTINESEQAIYTVEFDLRKSLVDPKGQDAILLKPRGVRVVENKLTGVLTGSVSEALINAEPCLNKVDLQVGNAVYIYQGTDLALENLGDDADQTSDENEVSPYTIGEVSLNDDSIYQFKVAYLPAGEYTIGFTCLAENDQPETDEGSEQGFYIQTQQSVSVQAEQRVTVTFE
ncbi:DUF4382 domain-containing protein [Paraglaciecola aestuariivivens]